MSDYEETISQFHRRWAVEQAMAINRYAPLDRILRDARRLEQFAAGRPPAKLIKINNGKDKK